MTQPSYLSKPLQVFSSRLVHFALGCWGGAQRRTAQLCLFIAAVCFGSACHAAVITYTVKPLEGTRWEYEYELRSSPDEPLLREFTIMFDFLTFANISLEASPSGWDTLVIEPDVNVASDGFLDGLALGQGLEPGTTMGGYRIAFDFLTTGTPGRQRFDVVDPITFAIIESGFTRAQEPVAIPEPGTVATIALAALMMVSSRRRNQKNREDFGSEKF